MEADQQRRLFLAMAIMMPLAFLFSWYSGRSSVAVAPAAAADAGMVAAAPATPPAEVKAPTAAAPEEGQATEVKQLQMDRVRAHYGLSTKGAGLTSAVLPDKKTREQTKLTVLEGFQKVLGGKTAEAPPMDLAIPQSPDELPLAISISGPRPVPANAVYLAAQEKDAIRFTLQRAGFEIEKELRWPALTGADADEDGYHFAMTVRVKNTSAEPAAGELEVAYLRAIAPGTEEAGSFIGGVGNMTNAACLVDDSVTRLHPSDKPPETKQGQVSFIAIDQQYFAGAIYPMEGPQAGTCVAQAQPTLRRSAGRFPLQLAPGAERTFRFGVFIGPKDVDMLAQAPSRMKDLGMAAAAQPQLDKLVDYGLWTVICRVLLGVLKFFHGLTHNWGVAIILLTVMVKVALVPLSVKAMVAAEATKKLQPKMEEIKKKYGQDRERQQLETMKLYQEAKVNPVGGCLPMLVQIPIWIALFTTLRTSYELYREPFIPPVWTDLTFRDPTYLLPIAMGITWILTQRSQPQMMDPMQAKMMTYIMPAVFTVMMLNYPMGLSLYIATNNVLTNAQQWGLKKYLARRAAKGATSDKPGEKHDRDTGKSGGRRQRTT